jgi:phage shock protein C
MSYYRKKDSFRERKRSGWGLGLYRNRGEGWLGGVCAGLADHWNVPNWMVRLGFLALFLFTGSVAFWGYVVAWFVLAPKPNAWADREYDPRYQDKVEMEYDEDIHRYRPRTVFRYSDTPAHRMRKASERLQRAAKRVQQMERYVTSRHYDLNREFSKL